MIHESTHVHSPLNKLNLGLTNYSLVQSTQLYRTMSLHRSCQSRTYIFQGLLECFVVLTLTIMHMTTKLCKTLDHIQELCKIAKLCETLNYIKELCKIVKL